MEAYAIQLASARNAYVKQLEGEDAAEELRGSIETFATALRKNIPEEVRDIKTTRQRKIIEAMATAIKQEQEARGLQGMPTPDSKLSFEGAVYRRVTGIFASWARRQERRVNRRRGRGEKREVRKREFDLGDLGD